MELKKPLYLIPVNSKQELNERIKIFYEENKKSILEEYTNEFSKKQNINIRLTWSEKGLANISTSPGGFDLDKSGRRFMFHNIYENSEIGKSLINIANKYVNLLIKN